MPRQTCVIAGLLLVALGIPAAARGDVPPVYEVLFTHIEDNTPGGTLGTTQSRNSYLLYRSRLISMAAMAESTGVPWSLQPDWKFLQAALLYEDASLTATTHNKNLLRYLKEDLGAVIDPHSHEGSGYNYTDVAHLLDSLGVGGSTVIGGHIWDPSLPQFSEWDRFRVPVQGARYPIAWWRGDILMGSGTPNHVNDPVVSGVWRPQDRDHYFVHDSTANMTSIGHYKDTINDVRELRSLYVLGAVPAQYMLTTSYPVKPSTLTRSDGIQSIRDSVLAPIVAMRDSGMVVATDFTSLIHTWETTFGSRGFLYDAQAVASVAPGGAGAGPIVSFERWGRNPFGSATPETAATSVRYTLSRPARIRLSVLDLQGREVAVLSDGMAEAGAHTRSWDRSWDASGLPSGVYFCRLEARGFNGRSTSASRTLKLVRIR